MSGGTSAESGSEPFATRDALVIVAGLSSVVDAESFVVDGSSLAADTATVTVAVAVTPLPSCIV